MRSATGIATRPVKTRKSATPIGTFSVVGAYQRCVTDTVGRFGGFVAKYMGDGVAGGIRNRVGREPDQPVQLEGSRSSIAPGCNCGLLRMLCGAAWDVSRCTGVKSA